MPSYHFLGKDVADAQVSPSFLPFTGVRIIVGNDDDGNQLVYESGDETGRVLEATNPWGTQQIADDMLARISGYAYQPWSAEQARIDPASELGDTVEVDGNYGVLASVDTTFSPLMTASISAPEGSDIDHEYPYEPKSNGAVARKINQAKASLLVDINSIEARVETTEGDIASLTITASSIESRVSTNEGNISTVTQTANKITWLVASGTSSSNFTLTDRAIELVASGINITGYVTISSLSTAGSTTINGSNITTGTVSASVIDVDNLKVQTIYGKTSYTSIPLLDSDASTVTLGAASTSSSHHSHIVFYAYYDMLFRGTSSTTGLYVSIADQMVYPQTSAGWRLGKDQYPFLDIMIKQGIWFQPSASVSVWLKCTAITNGIQLAPSVSTDVVRLGASSYPIAEIYTRISHIGDSTTSSTLGFFGATANKKQTLSLTSNNMGYSSVDSSNYLVALNNLIGILKVKHGLFA